MYYTFRLVFVSDIHPVRMKKKNRKLFVFTVIGTCCRWDASKCHFICTKITKFLYLRDCFPIKNKIYDLKRIGTIGNVNQYLSRSVYYSNMDQ